MANKIPHDPNYTVPAGKPGQERVRPDKVDYTNFDRSHPHKGLGYKGVGKTAPGGTGGERVRKDKVDYGKFDREHPYEGKKGGYKNVGKSASKTPSKGDERVRSDKVNKSPFKK